MHLGGSSLVPLTSSEEKATGRWSARQRGIGSEGKKKSLVNAGDTRSVANELDPYDRKSFDKGQTMHRSAIHAKTSGVIPKGGTNASGIYDINGLKL